MRGGALKCSLRVGFCLPRAVSERRITVASQCSFLSDERQAPRDARPERNDSDSAVTARAFSRENGGKSSRPQYTNIFSDANKVSFIFFV